MIVGNIVTTTKINVSDEFNIVQSMDEIIHGLPTLIIGFDLAIKYYPELDVLSRVAAENVFWTFKKNQRREIFEEDMYNFTKFVYSALTKKVTYYFIDPLQLSLKLTKRLLNKLNNLTNPIVYYHDNMIYIYADKTIFGLDLSLLDFVGINSKKTISKLLSKTNVFLIKDQIFIEYKNMVENLDNQVKFIPYLYSIENG